MLAFVIFAILASAFVEAQIPSMEACPNVTIVEDFDAARYLGKWYEAERYFFLFELGGKCSTAEYELGSDGVVKVTNKQISELTGTESTIKGTAKLAGAANEAKLIVNFPSLIVNVDAPYWVIDTDYENYSVVWSCNDLGTLSTRTAWILTRSNQPSSEIMKKAYAALDREKINKEYLMKINQKDCPKDN